jgi:hypothetical protein
MWEPTADDLDDLLAQYREVGDQSPRTPAQPAGPADPPENGTAAKAVAPQQSGAPRTAPPRRKAAGKSVREGPPLKSVESLEICGTIPEGFSQISIPPEVKSVDNDMKSVERHEICGERKVPT